MMIMVDIQVPATCGIYDFELDEGVPVGELVEKTAKLVAYREGMQYCGSDDMYLYAFHREKILDNTLSLKKQGIRSGERLILF